MSSISGKHSHDQGNLFDSWHLVQAKHLVCGHVIFTEHVMFTKYLASTENPRFAERLECESTKCLQTFLCV